jgi:hypothetical protein
MKLITTGATMVSSVEEAPKGKPDARPIPLVTAFSPLPNIAGSKRLPAAIQDELGSETPLTIWDHGIVPVVLGTISRIPRSAVGLSDLPAKPLSNAAIDGSIPRETACSGCPRALATSVVVRVSIRFTIEWKIEAAIFLLQLQPRRGTRYLHRCPRNFQGLLFAVKQDKPR